ncbi:cilia- and flagella-associated protein 97 [Anableps anableps]
MFTSSELEGEVDHSFFDSDGDNGRNVGEKTIEKDLKAEKRIPIADKGEPAKHSEHLAVDLSPGTEKRKRHLKHVENKKSGNKTDSSSVSFILNEPIHEGKDDFNLHSKRPSGAFLALLANMPNKGDNQRPHETRKSALAISANSKEMTEESPKKLVKNQHPENPPPTLNEAGTDADPESSCSSQRGDLSSTNLSQPTKSFVHRKTRGTRTGSAESQDFPSISTDESDSSVTDVSPLSSPDSSSLQSLSSDAEKERQQEQESVPSSGFSKINQEEDSNPDVDECSYGLESHLEHKLVLHCPGRMYRKNYSFSNNEVRLIERDNQLLLQKLSRFAPGARSGQTASKTTHVSSTYPWTRPAHSALNRQREQRRIEKENLAFLKRLQAVKATPGIRRAELLADYERLVRNPNYRHYNTSSRPVSSRAALTKTDSRSTPVHRSSTRMLAVQPGVKNIANKE